MSIETALDALHARARRNPFLHRFTEFNRILLGISFIAPGLTKALGNRFTVLGTDTPVGFFFEAMYQTGWYWRFIGLAQIVASLLVLFPRTAALGAMMFFPIILNIFVITVSLHFTGTPVITGLMLLACTYLLCWDYPKFKPLLFNSSAQSELSITEPQRHWLERIGFALAAISGLVLTLPTRGLGIPFSAPVVIGCLVIGFLGGLLILLGWYLVARQNRLQPQHG